MLIRVRMQKQLCLRRFRPSDKFIVVSYFLQKICTGDHCPLKSKPIVHNLILVQSQILTSQVDRSRNQLNENFQLVLCAAAGFYF